MSPWVYLLLLIGILLVILVILKLAGVTIPAHAVDDYDTDPAVELPDVPVEENAPTALAPQPLTPSTFPNEPRYIPKGFKREQAVCEALEAAYQRGFPTARPEWLKNPITGQRLEYHCYNADLKIAGEHNGQHHYIYPNSFHRSEREFLAQRQRDEDKRRLSDQHGVYLLMVPYWVPTDLIKDWVEYYCPERVAQRLRVEQLTPPKP